MSDAKYSLTKGQKLYLPLKRGIDIVLSGLGMYNSQSCFARDCSGYKS